MRTTRTPAVAAVLAATAGLVVSLLALLGWQRDQAALEPSPPPVSARQLDATDPPADPDPLPTAARAGGDPAKSAPRPVRLTVAGADLDMRVRPVGVAADGQMQLPADPAVLGWYRFGPAPGERGSAVLAGHLDTVRDGVGPLVRLREVSPGDRVEVATRTGTRRYQVVAVDRYDRQELPTELFARTGPERVRIITCGGAYVPGQGYEQNLVVTARPI